MLRSSRAKATVSDLHEIASALPEVERDPTDLTAGGRAAYRIRSKAFVVFRSPSKDAVDPVTGEPYEDVVVFHCTAQDKEALVGNPNTPFFTTSHWDGYNAVLLLERDLGRLTVGEMREVITDAWLARAPRRLATVFLATPADTPEGYKVRGTKEAKCLVTAAARTTTRSGCGGSRDRSAACSGWSTPTSTASTS